METAEKGELHGLLFASCVTVAAKTHFVQQSVHERNLHSLLAFEQRIEREYPISSYAANIF